LAALQAFFTAMPVASGMAFVVISHQQQEYPSLLPTLLARCTTMPIHEVTHAMPVMPDQIYLAAPGTQLALFNGTLQPMEHHATHRPAFPIDYFLCTLAKVESLTQANDDMQHLLNSTGIVTLFLDSQLRMKRFTPQVTRVIKMLPSDVGRPLGDLASTLAYDRLEADVQEVLQTLVSKSMIIPTHNGEQYDTRIIPYRTSDNAIDGVVMTFINLNTCQAKAYVQGR
jgi:PAS domain/CheB methylesterase